MIGFVPVLGKVEDMPHLAYMVMYRESFWGDRVTEGDILAQGLFTMLGVVADARDAVRLVGLEGKLFGIYGGEAAPGARIFQSKPGWPKWLKDALVEQNRKTLVMALENDTSKVISSRLAGRDAERRKNRNSGHPRSRYARRDDRRSCCVKRTGGFTLGCCEKTATKRG
jgi:hypothetical protein